MANTVLTTQVTDRDAEALIVTTDAKDRTRILVMVPHQTLDANHDWVGTSLTDEQVLTLIGSLVDSLRSRGA